MRWKSIPDTDNTYKISNTGEVVNVKTGNTLTPSEDPSGYLNVTLCYASQQRTAYVHRLVAELFLKRKSDENVVAFKNLNKRDCRASNLRWTTTREVMSLRVTTSAGSNNAMAILTEEKVKEIKRRLKLESVKALAREFGVSPSTVYKIKSGKQWAHVKVN